MNSSGAGISTGMLIFYLIIIIIEIAALWKVFTKAGKPGWASIIPVYNIIVLVQIIKKPAWWWIVIVFVPFVNIIFLILAMIELAKVFGKGGGFAVGLILFPYIFLPILAWGDAQYQGDNTPTTN